MISSFTYRAIVVAGQLTPNKSPEGTAVFGTSVDLMTGAYPDYSTRMLTHFGLVK